MKCHKVFDLHQFFIQLSVNFETKNMKISFSIMRLFLLCVLGFLMACKPNLKDPKVKSLYDEVMVIHDDVMPEISTIHKLKKKLKKYADDDSSIFGMMKELDDADEAMMSWMSDFGKFKTLKDESQDVKISYLTEEKQKISDVSNQMRSIIKRSENYLQTKE